MSESTPQKLNPTLPTRHKKRMQEAIDYIYRELPLDLMKEYSRTKLQVQRETAKSHQLRAIIEHGIRDILRSSTKSAHGELDEHVFQQASRSGAEAAIDTMVQNDILYISKRAWEPYRKLQKTFFDKLIHKSPDFLDDFQLHMNGLINEGKPDQKLVRRETLVDLIVERRSRKAPLGIQDFIDVFG